MNEINKNVDEEYEQSKNQNKDYVDEQTKNNEMD